MKFRPATAEDLDWLVELRAQVLRPDLERLGRFDELRVRERMRASFVPASTRIIRLAAHDVGCVTVRCEADERWIEHFYLAPAAQGQGVGSTVMRAILDEPGTAPWKLNVLQGSRARALYERFGFAVESEDAVDVYMARASKCGPQDLTVTA